MELKGTQKTKEFYDTEGWHETEPGTTVDGDLFGVKEDGPIRREMYDRMWARVVRYIGNTDTIKVLEVGCGGSPEVLLLDVFDHYTGTDFSALGLEVAKSNLQQFDGRLEFVEADAVSLPFSDESFDTVYCAHTIYHIEDRASQAAAMSEMLRVLRPGGALVLITANPRPLLFPLRFIVRLVADIPLLKGFARKLKGKAPIPYSPSKLSWYKAQTSSCSDREIVTGGIASTSFNQNVSEYTGFGKILWSIFDYCDRKLPHVSAYLGNYVVVLARK